MNTFIIATIEPLTKLMLRKQLKENFMKISKSLGYSEVKELLEIFMNYKEMYQSEEEIKDKNAFQEVLGKGLKNFYYGILEIDSLDKLSKLAKYRTEIVDRDFYLHLTLQTYGELLQQQSFTFEELKNIPMDDLHKYLADLEASIDDIEIDWGFKGQLALVYKNYEEALHYFNKGIEIDPKEDYKSWYYKEIALMNLDQTEKDFHGFHEARKINPDFSLDEWVYDEVELEKLQDSDEFLLCIKNPDKISPNLGKLMFIQIIKLLKKLPDLYRNAFVFEWEVVWWIKKVDNLFTTFIAEDLIPTQRLLNILKEFIIFSDDALYCMCRFWSRLDRIYKNVIQGVWTSDSKNKVKKLTDFFEVVYLLSIDFFGPLSENTRDYMFESSDGNLEYWFARQLVFDGSIGDEISGIGHEPYKITKEGTIVVERMYVDREDDYKEKKKEIPYDFKK